MNNESDTEEEILVYAEFEENVNIGKYRSIHALGIDSKNPIVQMDDTFFTGKLETPVGTYMFFDEDTAPQSHDLLFDKIPTKPLKYACKTSKLLKMDHAFVTPKEDKVQDSEIKIPEDDFVAVSFSSIQEGIEAFRECLKPKTEQAKEEGELQVQVSTSSDMDNK